MCVKYFNYKNNYNQNDTNLWINGNEREFL